MFVRTLSVAGLRNIREARLTLGSGSVLILGRNGAGKTTVLEAIYLLARGRSFRSHRSGDLTTVGAQETRIHSVIENQGLSMDWTFIRGGRNHGRWIDGVAVGQGAQHGVRLAVRLVGENAPQLLEADPALRRRFLDWNLFHVEQGYGTALARYRVVLDQRNAWLKQGGRGRSVWDEEFITSGELLDRLRCRGVAAIAAAFDRLTQEFDVLSGVTPTYLRGTPRDCSLADALAADSEAEKAVGFTRVGPHRSDISLVRDGKPASLSRGQIKLAVCLMQLACDAVEMECSHTRSIWLLDDLACDLDDETADRLVSLFVGSECQCIFTAIGTKPARLFDRLPASAPVFQASEGIIARV